MNLQGTIIIIAFFILLPSYASNKGHNYGGNSNCRGIFSSPLVERTVNIVPPRPQKSRKESIALFRAHPRQNFADPVYDDFGSYLDAIVKIHNNFWKDRQGKLNTLMALPPDLMEQFINQARVLVMRSENGGEDIPFKGILLTYSMRTQGAINKIWESSHHIWKTITSGSEEGNSEKADAIIYWSIVAPSAGLGYGAHLARLANEYFQKSGYNHRTTMSPVKEEQYSNFIERLRQKLPESRIKDYAIYLYLISVRIKGEDKARDRIIGFEPYMDYLASIIPGSIPIQELQGRIHSLIAERKILSPIEFIREENKKFQKEGVSITYKMFDYVTDLHENQCGAELGGFIKRENGGRPDGPYTLFHVYDGFTDSKSEALEDLVLNLAVLRHLEPSLFLK